VSTNRYGAFDSNGNYLVTIEKAKLINKDYQLFYVNYISNQGKSKNINYDNTQFNSEATFKPQIDKKSNKLYNEYRRKVLEDPNSSNNSVKNHLDYIDKLIMKKRKKEK
jgi:hypothetical protein